MIRRPPRSTLFPYTTPSDLPPRGGTAGPAVRSWAGSGAVAPVSGPRGRVAGRRPGVQPVRSEEHTSELQSQSNLVCRLLLEKKKKKKNANGKKNEKQR